jgi:hypothetical protein
MESRSSVGETFWKFGTREQGVDKAEVAMAIE